MKAIMVATVLALAAAPWWAAAKPAPPMTVTRIDGKSVDPIIAFMEASSRQSMVVDAALVTMFNIHATDAPPPPPKYDRPYPNVEVVYDLPWDGDIWGFTEPPARAGERCVIHLAPLGSAFEVADGIELLDPVGAPRLLRHEYGHCYNLIHDPDKPSKWREVAPADREKLAALTHRKWLEITRTHTVAARSGFLKVD